MEQIRLGYLDAPLHEASAAAVARVLEAHDLEVAYVPAHPGALAAAFEADDMDLFASAWLPLTDATMLASGRMEPIGMLYRPAFIWCVAAAEPAGIGDLAAEARLDRRILAPESGPTAELSHHVLRAYGLDVAGFRIEAVSDAEAHAWAAACDPARIVPLCRPHDLLHASALRALRDPLGALGPEQEARLLIRHSLRDSLDRDLLDELDELTLGNKVVSAMAHAMRMQGMSAGQAADAWQRGKLTPRV